MSAVATLDRELLRSSFPLPDVAEDSDKEDRGRLLVVAGSRELAGAALLAGVGGLRAGAGKLQIATAESIAPRIAIAVPEARVIGFAETEEGCFDPSGIDRLLKLAKDVRAVTIGCGLQHGPALDAMLDGLLASGIETPLVLDATVLGSLAPRAEAVRAWRGAAIVLPHAREMAMMLGCAPEAVEADPLAAARRAAAHFDVVALVKGPVSVVAAPDGHAFRYEGGGVGLATSGSGDVLAGIVGGLSARGAEPLTAILWGVYLHGEAGRLLTKQIGRIGFLARELLDRVPGLLES
ncbi:MAG TPA: NAD(P)H-hydrate dehydratase [Allosphingosinicella sp.]